MAKDINKRILMFSGGMDSFILKTIFKIPNSECLFVRMGTPENIIEEKFLDNHFPGALKANLPLSDFSLENNIIPFRNHMLCLIGAQFGNQIYFGFTAGDTTKDKDFVFKAQMEGILQYFSLDEQKVKIPGPYSVEMPFKFQSKTNLVTAYFLAGGNPVDLIEKSKSCYQGSENGCGVCRSCLRKYVALSGADKILGQKYRYSLEADPTISLPAFLEESIQKGRDASEIEEIKKCL